MKAKAKAPAVAAQWSVYEVHGANRHRPEILAFEQQLRARSPEEAQKVFLALHPGTVHLPTHEREKWGAADRPEERKREMRTYLSPFRRRPCTEEEVEEILEGRYSPTGEHGPVRFADLVDLTGEASDA